MSKYNKPPPMPPRLCTLKPCPFCGESSSEFLSIEDRRTKDEKGPCWHVVCSCCCAVGPFACNPWTPDEAANLWNDSELREAAGEGKA